MDLLKEHDELKDQAPADEARFIAEGRMQFYHGEVKKIYRDDEKKRMQEDEVRLECNGT